MKRNVFNITALILIFVLITSAFIYAAEIPTDVKGESYETAVTALVEKGILTGDTDGNFYPESNLTRAQACIIVVKSMNPQTAEVMGTATQPAPKSGFRDMGGFSWAEGYIGYAVRHNIAKGYLDGTFKPGNKVTTNELVTMVIRAAGYSDQSLGGTWPSNFINKANELNLLTNLPTPLPVFSTKWMAAQIDYNALGKITAANPPTPIPSQGTDKDKADSIPNTTSMIYANGSFNSTMTAYDGKTIASDVKVYTYGIIKDYASSMRFSKNISDYRLDTVYKFKSAKTPAYYQLTDGKITTMVVPMDAGFSGKAYSVINDTLTSLNARDDSVRGLQTLTATREVTWLGKKGLAGPVSAEYLNGELYELSLSNGEIQGIHKATDVGKEGAVFEEISNTTAAFVSIESYEDGVVKIVSGGAVFAVEDNASVYVIDSNDPKKYKVGSVWSIRDGVQIRAYDISDNDIRNADIVIIKY